MGCIRGGVNGGCGLPINQVTSVILIEYRVHVEKELIIFLVGRLYNPK